MKSGPEGDADGAEIYRKFLELLERYAGEMKEFLFEIQKLVPSTDFCHLRHLVGMVLGHGHMPVTEEICQKYPALKHDWMK